MENNKPATNNFLNWVEIKNFKSIKDLRLDCKRVNVFIGKPNVGKSNILEGLGLLGGSYSEGSSLLKDFIRYKDLSNLYYDDDVALTIEVNSDKIDAVFGYDLQSETYYYVLGQESWIDKFNEAVTRTELSTLFNVNHSFLVENHNKESYNKDVDNLTGEYPSINRIKYDIKQNGKSYKSFGSGYRNPIKRYEFKYNAKQSNIGENFLWPPYGENLFNVIDHDEEIRKDLAEVFRPNGLNLVLSKKERRFSIQKQIDGYVYNYPYSNIADTFQRYAFYLAAIESNTNSVIILEEPEVHSFPPYTQELTYRMIYSELNQFFVTTHSPYLLQTLIENLSSDQLNVFVTYYENYETKVRALTFDELREVMDFGIDIFYNLEKYQPND